MLLRIYTQRGWRLRRYVWKEAEYCYRKPALGRPAIPQCVPNGIIRTFHFYAQAKILRTKYETHQQIHKIIQFLFSLELVQYCSYLALALYKHCWPTNGKESVLYLS